jgi:hypothetical protein
MNERCYNRFSGNALKGFWALRLLPTGYVYWLVGCLVIISC